MKEESMKDEVIQEEETVETNDQPVEGLSEPAKVIEISLEEANRELREKLREAEVNAAEYLDGWQRARAEFANARKRLEKDRAAVYKKAAVDNVRQLLPILDDFDRALEAAPADIANHSWFEGIILVRRKLSSMLDALDVVPIEAVGQPFDPNFHEALTLVTAENVDSGIVVEELQKGYRLNDSVIRPSLVNVAE